ncbi:hypothetical protein EMEDMD4_510033 [Sinorhizobium medicae]|uniref:Uncharacterized protein n=1 Tax=Sinorhizobium medicae TaxID=110321 RepID=A0A508X261_9HYPH|nr:hypothetical protein EMEDMD4_510033 [Sinorhizobium medicae]
MISGIDAGPRFNHETVTIQIYILLLDVPNVNMHLLLLFFYIFSQKTPVRLPAAKPPSSRFFLHNIIY